jgi:penicillin-binding protein 1A
LRSKPSLPSLRDYLTICYRLLFSFDTLTGKDKKKIHSSFFLNFTAWPKYNRMKKSIRIFWMIFLGGFGAFVLLILLIMLGVFGRLPKLKELENPSIVQASEVIASDGTLMGRFYSEKGNRSIVNYKDISPNIINALVATEDERFYDHSGIDFKRTLSAIFFLGSRGGGSTITQQLALNLFAERAKNPFTRGIQKLKEYIIAIRLERNFTKQEIIALYLNAVPFGDNVYGIRNASRTFFQKEPDRVNPVEAATLIGMLKGNSIYNPRTHVIQAFNRKNVVLGQMERNGYLSAVDAAKYKAMPIPLNYKKSDQNNGYAPYFQEAVLKDEVRNALKDMTNPDGDTYDIYKDGLKIYTTINPKMQQYAEEAMAQQMPMLQKALNAQSNIKKGTIWKAHPEVLTAAMKNSERWKNGKEEGLTDEEIKKTFSKKVPMKVFAWNAKRELDTVMTPMDSIKYHRQMMQSGFMVMDPVSGEVKAWVGGISFKTYKLDHVNMKTKRQVGSSIKPLLYCQAIEERGMNPNSMVEDVQQDFGNKQLVPATTRSCSGRSVTMANALTWSRNCASAYIMKQVGPAQFANFLNEKLNIPTKVDAYPSIALGACDLSLYEMMWAYTIFAGGGFETKPSFISRIEDRNGNVIKRFDIGANRKETISEATAYQMVQMMEGPVTIGTAVGLKDRLGAKEMAGKTGTTNDNADFWFMGFTPQLLAGVWVGCDDRFIQIQSGAYMGGTAARPVWEAFFKKVYADQSLGIRRDAEFSKPADLYNELNDANSINYGDSVEENMEDGFTQEDYLDTITNIPSESQPPIDENAPPARKDNTRKDTGSTKATKIGEMGLPQDQKKDKKGTFLQRVFGKKNKNNQ